MSLVVSATCASRVCKSEMCGVWCVCYDVNLKFKRRRVCDTPTSTQIREILYSYVRSYELNGFCKHHKKREGGKKATNAGNDLLSYLCQNERIFALNL